MRTARKVLLVFVSLVLVLALLLAIFIPFTVRQSFPQTKGEMQAPGLQAPVEVRRDSFGIPHIYAQSTHDLFFAQGYVHAQERFWQMDFWRHLGSGTLAEMFGDAQSETDLFLRTLGWRRVVEEEVKLLDPETRAILEAYAEGVNAYLAENSGSELSLEYAVLKALNPSYQPEPWIIQHTLTWGKAMAWDLRGNMSEEIARARLLKTLSPEQIAQLYPPYPQDHPVIVTGAGTAAQPQAQDLALAYGAFEAGLAEAGDLLAGVNSLLGPVGDGIGSNSWAVDGTLSATGNPLLVNDPHLSSQLPSIWYEVGLHCLEKGPACPYEVTGFSFAGVPGVVIGHNDRIAWGLTNVGPDVMDLYIEKINPENPDQYEVNGAWVDMTKLTETIQVAGKDPIELTVRYTRHGPVITEVYFEEDFAGQVGMQLPENYAIALRWTALEPGAVFTTLLGFNKAQNFEEFHQAAAHFSAPAQNFLYADVDGNIGYQMPGLIPIRAKGDGRLPVPGWTDEYEWQGYVPYEELPSVLNPAEGYIVTANNAVVGADYPYMITQDWDYGYRAERIVEMIEGAGKPIDAAYMQQMQGDNYNKAAEIIVPLLLEMPLEDETLAERRALLAQWDFQQDMDSAAGALFQMTWKHIMEKTFHDELPEDYWPNGGGRWFEVVRNIAGQADAAWWDNIQTPEVETRDTILAEALASAVEELEAAQGRDPQKWRWGDLHIIYLVHQTLGQSGVAPVEALFNRGPYETAGGSSIVNATGFDILTSFETDWVPSMRMIVDLGALQNSQAIHLTGQSGHAYHPHYTDMTDLWRKIEYHPMLWTREQVETASGDQVLTLKP